MTTSEAFSGQLHLPTGALLQDGKYRIVRVLGQGGFGITYLAEHKNFGEVALKELFLSSGSAHCSRENTTQRHVIAHFDRTQFEDFKKRFLDEARTLYRLRDVKGVVKVIDIFEENSTVYFSMEYLEGDKLEEYVKKRKYLSEHEGIKIIESVAKTLSAIHKRNVLHRDIKPSNIIIGREGDTYLIDFGIARSYVEDTETHTTFHSPRYSPPEQKIAKSRMGTYSDVYSLGATAYFVFTGQPPQSIEERITENYKSPQSLVPNLSDSINETITQSLTIRDRDRIQNMDDLLDALATSVHPVYRGKEMPSTDMPPQYLPPDDEKTRLFSSIAPKNDDANKINPPKLSKPLVADDATMIIPVAPVRPARPTLVEDDKTILNPLPFVDNTPEIDTEKTLIIGYDTADKAVKKSEPFSWKAWIKTRDGRIIGISALLSLILITGALLSPLFYKQTVKNTKTAEMVLPKDTVIAKSVDTTAALAVTTPKLPPVEPVSANKNNKPAVKDIKVKTKPAIQQTYSAPYRPSIQETPTLPSPNKVESTTPIGEPDLKLKPYVGKYSLVTLSNNMSCVIKGESGTYRKNRETKEWIELICTTNGKDHVILYYKNTDALRFENNDLKRQ